jgi:ribosomal-protein-alanine N-acetyltransferase
MLTHKGTQTLKTERLILRRLQDTDAEAMYNNWATDEKTTKFLSWNPYTDIEKLKEFITNVLMIMRISSAITGLLRLTVL